MSALLRALAGPLLAACLALPAAAAEQATVAFAPFTAPEGISADAAVAVYYMTLGEFTRLADMAQSFGCAVAVLPEPGAGAGHLVEGTVGAVDGRISWEVRLSRAADGAVLADERGGAAQAEVVAASEGLAARLLSALCPRRGFRAAAARDGLELDGLICDPTRPFDLTGAGRAAGLVIRLTPETTEGGRFEVIEGGAGAGAYTQSLAPEGGALRLTGDWTAGGTAGGTLEATLTPADGGC